MTQTAVLQQQQQEYYYHMTNNITAHVIFTFKFDNKAKGGWMLVSQKTPPRVGWGIANVLI